MMLTERLGFIIFNVIIMALVIYTEYKYPYDIEYVSNCCKAEYRESMRRGQSEFYCLTCKKWCDLEDKKKEY